MRVNLKGIHRVNKRLAGGGVATYWYAWRGGPRIMAPPGSAGFLVEYSEAQRTRSATGTNTLRSLVDEFRDSSEFTGTSASSQRAYKSYLRKIEIKFGDLPIAAISDPAVRGRFKAWRDSMAAKPRTADYAWTTLARVLSVAKDRGRIQVNPCERGGRLYAPDRTERLWTDSHIAAFSEKASEPLRMALTLALWTGQRQGDLLQLRWEDYDGKRIRLQQSKTGATVSVRVAAPLKQVLDTAVRHGKTILVNTDGNTWTSDGFRASWSKVCKRAEIEGLTFHDLRGSAITRLAMAGATPQEIAGVTGHSIADVSAMLDRHYLGDRAALGDKAIKRLERSAGKRKTGLQSDHK